MTMISIEDAQAKLPELIDGLLHGEHVAIVRGDRVVARLVGESAHTSPEVEGGPVPATGPWACKAGSEKTDKFWMSPDFDEPLEEFREYME